MAWDWIPQSGFAKGMNLHDNKRGLPDGQAQVVENFLVDDSGILFIPDADAAYNDARVPGEVLGLWRHYGPNTQDHRLVALSNGSIRTADLNGVFQTGIAAWQSTLAPCRHLSQRYYSYAMDGASEIRALGPVADGWIDPIPAAPTITLAMSTVYGWVDKIGFFAYKYTNVNPVGESSASPLLTSDLGQYIYNKDPGSPAHAIYFSGFTAKSGDNYTKLYRASALSTADGVDPSVWTFYFIKKFQWTNFTDGFEDLDADGSYYIENLFEPTAKFGVEWRDRVFWAKDNTIFASDALVPTAVKYVIDVGGDGVITGLAGLPNMLIIFKPTSIYALSGYDEDDWTTAPFTTEHGCNASRSIAEFENYIWWVGNGNVWQMGPDGSVDRIGDAIRDLVQDFPANRLDTYVVGAYHDARYYLSLDDGVSPKCYVYHIGPGCWTRLDGAYSAYASLSAPGDTTFSGRFSPFMGADTDGNVYEIQDATTKRTSAYVQGRQMDAGNPFAAKLYRSLRLDLTPGASSTVSAFCTSGLRTGGASVPVADPTRITFPREFQGEAFEPIIMFESDGNGLVFRGYAVEQQGRPVR